ncbi:hypothetical protein [Micromonospora andamanensis]|uniref:hypothetical protein n=1 Tax=Micromonospora andamanensis TaxID=1287068 RepID=UPI0019525E4F|nr:hypothetical protein [Micromonospora andamanensis]
MNTSDPAPQHIFKGSEMDPKSASRTEASEPTVGPTLPGRAVLRIELARDAATSQEVIELLANDPNSKVKCAVAGRLDLPEHLLHGLAADPNNKVRQALAENPTCPPAVLAGLVDDPSFDVRYAVLVNPRADRYVHEMICRSSDEDIRRLLAESQSIEEDIKTTLLRDPSVAVRGGMAETTVDPQILAALVSDPEPKVRAKAALNPLTTQEQRRRLARDKAASVRWALVQSVELAEESLEELVHDRSVNVRWWLATTPQTPHRFLRILTEDKSPEVRTQARMRLGLKDGAE